MKWRGERKSSNVRDMRGSGPAAPSRGSSGFRLPGGGGAGMPGRIGGSGWGGIALIAIVIVVALVSGGDLGSLFNAGTGPQTSTQTTAEQQELVDFASVVLADTEDTWATVLPRTLGRQYENPTLTLFSGAVQSACGFAEAAVGPFYCPRDRQLYLDLSFFDELNRRFGAPGDFAQAYVIAHEVGHHIQNLMGTLAETDRQGAGLGERAANALSVQVELQADCFAGVWGYYARQQNLLETGDLEEALNAASAIGDDRLQQQAGGRIQPDSFTHGTSEQRMRWFRRGFESGDPRQCDTFGAGQL